MRRLRLEAELTQEELANGAGIAPRHLQKIEAGEVNVTLRTIEAIAAALNEPAAVLFEIRAENGGR